MIEFLRDPAIDACINLFTYTNRYMCTYIYIEFKWVLVLFMQEQDSKVQLQSCFLQAVNVSLKPLLSKYLYSELLLYKGQGKQNCERLENTPYQGCIFLAGAFQEQNLFSSMQKSALQVGSATATCPVLLKSSDSPCNSLLPKMLC